MFGTPWAGPIFISEKQYEKRLKELNERYVKKNITKAETSSVENVNNN